MQEGRGQAGQWGWGGPQASPVSVPEQRQGERPTPTVGRAALVLPSCHLRDKHGPGDHSGPLNSVLTLGGARSWWGSGGEDRKSQGQVLGGRQSQGAPETPRQLGPEGLRGWQGPDPPSVWQRSPPRGKEGAGGGGAGQGHRSQSRCPGPGACGPLGVWPLPPSQERGPQEGRPASGHTRISQRPRGRPRRL